MISPALSLWLDIRFHEDEARSYAVEAGWFENAATEDGISPAHKEFREQTAAHNAGLSRGHAFLARDLFYENVDSRVAV